MADTAVKPLPAGHHYTAEDIDWWQHYVADHPDADPEQAAEAIEVAHQIEHLEAIS